MPATPTGSQPDTQPSKQTVIQAYFIDLTSGPQTTPALSAEEK